MFSTPRTRTFLRALKRHDDGEWLRARKADDVAHVQAPLIRFLNEPIAARASAPSRSRPSAGRP